VVARIQGIRVGGERNARTGPGRRLISPSDLRPAVCDLPEEELAEYLAWRATAEVPVAARPRGTTELGPRILALDEAPLAVA